MSYIKKLELRHGKPMPQICGSQTATDNLVMFSFGIEEQESFQCACTQSLVSSDDACLAGGEVFSAQYRSLGRTIDNQLAFSSSVTLEAVMRPGVLSDGRYGSSTGGTYIPPVIGEDIAGTPEDNGSVDTNCTITKNSDDGNPDCILDSSSVNVNMNNEGLATLNYSILCRENAPTFGLSALQLGNKRFEGQTVNVISKILKGSQYTEYQVTALGVLI